MASSSSSPEITSATAAVPESVPHFSYKDATQDEVLDDLSSRFILNLPDEELASLERLCFQVEQAHWFYEDFIREENNHLPSLPLKRFSEMLFHACPLLQHWSHDHEQAFNTFMQYKTRVPVCGAIMLNETMDKCVLVKGWKASSGWGFPKGKINQTEPPHVCAIREVLEETGYNLAGQLNPSDILEISIKEQKISLFIVPGVPEDFHFKTKTRKEISKIEWFKLTDLPTWKRNKAAPGRFYLISPFIFGLKQWIKQRKPREGNRKGAKQKKAQPTGPEVVQKQGVSKGDRQPLQESHSQSSVDNPGPHTPSAQETEVPIKNTTSDMVNLDPHFARLLSSLTLSATVPSEPKKPDGGVLEQRIFESSSAYASDVSTNSPVVPQPTFEQPDWSSSAPRNIQPVSTTNIVPNRATSDIPSTTRASPSLASPTIQSLSPSQNINVITNGPTIHSSLTSPPPPSAASLSPKSTRKLVGTADISPYLAKATEFPTSGKRLQQISLLEAVADESARMAPIIAARAARDAMYSRGSQPIPHNSTPSLPPMQSPSTLHMNHPGPPSSAAGFHSRYPILGISSAYPDPLEARSRTSQAFHRPSMHHSTGSVSINQNHLLATINGTRGGPVSPNYAMGQQFLQQQRHSAMFNPNPPFYGTSSLVSPYQPAPLPIHSYGTLPAPLPPQVSNTIRTYLNPTPNLASTTNAPTPNSQTASSLLSLLNGKSTPQNTGLAPSHQ